MVERIAIMYRVNEDIYSILKKLAKEHRWSLSKLTEEAVETYLKMRKRI